MKLPSFGEFAIKGKLAFKRFPITLSWAIIGTVFTLFAIESDTFDKTFYWKTILTFTLGISWLISTRFFEEQFKKDKEWVFLITIGFLIFFYTTLPNEGSMSDEQVIRYMLYFITGHLLIFVAPFILKYDKNAYFNYLKSIFIAIVRSLFFSMILYLGIVLALLAIKHLFNADFNDTRYAQILVICLGIVNTWIYLSDFPKEVHTQTQINYTKALEVLVKYILIPLVILYLIILYAYSLKIVINWNLPKGWVSYLVAALAFLGFIIQLLIHPVQKTIDSCAIRKFYPWFYFLLLPLLVLLFVAIFRRINDYGITENRYFVLILALWILGMTLYMLFSKSKITKWFPLSLSLLALLVSFGFWGAFSVSTKSQVNQFEKLLDDIKSTNFSTTSDKESRLQSIAQYLAEKRETDKLKNVLSYNPEKEFNTDSYWNISYRIIDSLNIKIIDKKDTEVRKNFSYGVQDPNITFDVKGYDKMQQIYLYKGSNKYYEKGIYKAFLEKRSSIVTIWKSDTMLETIDCKPLVEKLLKQENTYKVPQNALTLKKGTVKIVFKNISIRTDDETNKKYLNSGNAYLFIKEK